MRRNMWCSAALAVLLIAGGVGVVLAGCGSSSGTDLFKTVVPILSSLSVNSGAPGTEVRLMGQGFGDGVDSRVEFAGVKAGVLEWRDTYIDVNVPSACNSGAVSVTTPGGTSNPIGFTVLTGGTTWGDSDTTGGGEDESSGMTEEAEIVAAMEAYAGGFVDTSEWDFDIIEISSIDPSWALGGASHKYEPESHQGEIFWLHKVGGNWTVVDSGTGLEHTDVPGAPSDLSP